MDMAQRLAQDAILTYSADWLMAMMAHSAAPSVLHLARRLQPKQAHLAFALAQQAYPDLTQPQWDSFISTACSDVEDGGPVIYGVENLRGYIMGICIGRLSHMPLYGRLFDVDPFLVFDITDSGTLSRSLFLTLEHHARSAACNAIRIAAPTGLQGSGVQAQTTLSFSRAGGKADDPTFLRRLLGSEQVTRSIYTLSAEQDR